MKGEIKECGKYGVKAEREAEKREQRSQIIK